VDKLRHGESKWSIRKGANISQWKVGASKTHKYTSLDEVQKKTTSCTEEVKVGNIYISTRTHTQSNMLLLTSAGITAASLSTRITFASLSTNITAV